MLLNVVFASPAPPLPSFSTSHTIFAVASLVFAVEEFKIRIWKAEDNMNQRKQRKSKSDHYSFRNRENKTHKFAGRHARTLPWSPPQLVRHNNPPPVPARLRNYAFRFRDFEGCSGPIFVLKVAK